MKCFGLWSGGANYAAPAMEDAEEFASRTEALLEFEARLHNWDGQTPLVDWSARMLLYRTHPGEESDPHPTTIIHIGPRGGIQRVAV